MLLDRLSGPVRGVRIVRNDPQPSDPSEIGAQIIPHRRLFADEVATILNDLGDVTGTIVTSALNAHEQQTFRDMGFTDREHLYLFDHSLGNRPTRTGGEHRLRNGRRTDLNHVLTIDKLSFEKFWMLDRESLHAARKATPVHRYRVATLGREVVGYAITGRAGRSSFLQRLGVHPSARGRGIGTDLVRDGMEWAFREGATSMLVNTQTKNERARRLYEQLGFTLSDDRLVVLEWTP